MKNVTRLAGTGFPLALLLILAGEAWSKPRPPLPPLPERSTFFLRCDQTNWWGDLRPAPLVFDNIQLVESWSGYAFHSSTKQASRLQYRLVETDTQTSRTRTNLNLAVGSIRLWFNPADWSSASLGGTGPGLFGRLIEVGTWTQDARFGWWSLYFADDGDSIHFSAQAKGEQADYLKAPIQLRAGTWHLITLTYGPKFCAFYLDGELVAQDDGVTVLPDAKVQDPHGFCIGTDLLGGNAAGGALDEITIFDRQLGAEEIAHYYRNTRPIADLGPVTEAEEQARVAQWAAWREAAAQLKSAAAESGTMSLLDGGGGDWPESGETNGFWLVSLQVQGTNLSMSLFNADTNKSYDIYFTLALQDSNTVWSSIASHGQQGQTNFTVPVMGDVGFLRAFEGSDWDGDGILNWMDANPVSTNTGALTVTIEMPTNGATIY